MTTKEVLEELKRRLEEKMKASFEIHNEEEGHGLCFASEEIDNLASELGIQLDFDSSYG